ncbi:hypothetical protein BVE84_04845 [Streptococcus azizii]|uniref:MacB-like periplasmic core domain-containing protein n=2 Tax=Streptococcus azizii TaxID=1579424 RepID=A0ABX3IG49_9STRE|nr:MULTISPECIES: hypothetical protein [Streptococcus]MBF0776747.1 hypothetical protein [Streptococcus sp. 19428wD3_AN2]ONK29850.1 hypothetical protein BVE84_04845 [Streptococcus azizii]TFU82484.1 hypothetical protein E4T83_08335 [Streptococcus sp. AN2]
MQISSKHVMTKRRKVFSLSLLHGVSIVLVVLLTSLITISSQLLLKNSQARHNLNQMSHGYSRYTLIDTLLEDADFYQFRTDREKLNTLVNFYNSLYQSQGFEFLPTFNQPLFIQSFDKGENFLYSREIDNFNQSTPQPMAVKSFQISQKAFNFYQLTVEEGEEFDWKNMTLSNLENYPIILGHHYRGHYQVGDKLVAGFYTKDVTFEVKGFLPPNSYVYYKGNPEFYLDDYLVVPYPPILAAVGADDFSFEGILYFAMLNSQFVTRLSEGEMLRVIQRYSHQSGFVDYSIIEVDDFFIKYEQLLSAVTYSRMLLIILLVVLSSLFCYLIISLSILILRYYRDSIRVSWLMGNDLKARILFRICSLYYMVSILTCLLIEIILFKDFLILPFGLLGNLLLYLGIYSILCKKTGYS